jgi:hypothetical protein
VNEVTDFKQDPNPRLIPRASDQSRVRLATRISLVRFQTRFHISQDSFYFAKHRDRQTMGQARRRRPQIFQRYHTWTCIGLSERESMYAESSGLACSSTHRCSMYAEYESLNTQTIIMRHAAAGRHVVAAIIV